jgi:hypothetical protein
LTTIIIIDRQQAHIKTLLQSKSLQRETYITSLIEYGGIDRNIRNTMSFNDRLRVIKRAVVMPPLSYFMLTAGISSE